MLCHFCLAALKGIKPSLQIQCRYLSVGRSILHRIVRPMALHPNMWAACPFHSPHYSLWALPAMTQFSEWQHSSFGSLSASVNGYRHHPSALCTCPSGGLQPNHFTCGPHPSSVDALVDFHDSSCNFPFFHPGKLYWVDHWVTTLPLFSCGVLFSSPPEEVVLHGVGLVHLSCVWWLPIHKGMSTSDAMRRSWFWWRTHDHPCWFVIL